MHMYRTHLCHENVFRALRCMWATQYNNEDPMFMRHVRTHLFTECVPSIIRLEIWKPVLSVWIYLIENALLVAGKVRCIFEGLYSFWNFSVWPSQSWMQLLCFENQGTNIYLQFHLLAKYIKCIHYYLRTWNSGRFRSQSWIWERAQNYHCFLDSWTQFNVV